MDLSRAGLSWFPDSGFVAVAFAAATAVGREPEEILPPLVCLWVFCQGESPLFRLTSASAALSQLGPHGLETVSEVIT